MCRQLWCFGSEILGFITCHFARIQCSIATLKHNRQIFCLVYDVRGECSQEFWKLSLGNYSYNRSRCPTTGIHWKQNKIFFFCFKLDYVAQAYVIPRVPTTCKGMQKCRKHSCRVNRSATKSKFRCFGCLLRDVNFDDFGQKEQNAFRDTHLDDLGFPKMYEPELYGDWCGRKRDAMDPCRVFA